MMTHITSIYVFKLLHTQVSKQASQPANKHTHVYFSPFFRLIIDHYGYRWVVHVTWQQKFNDTSTFIMRLVVIVAVAYTQCHRFRRNIFVYFDQWWQSRINNQQNEKKNALKWGTRKFRQYIPLESIIQR